MGKALKKYESPKLVRLSMTDMVARDAAKWWKVDEEINRLIVKHESFGGDDFSRELGSFIVKLVKG